MPRLPYKYDSLNIETTSYALLTYASRQELLVDSIVRWLNAQRLTDGGWASTQDTGVAMKALIEYTQRTRIRDVSTLSVTIEATSLPGQTKVLDINERNLAQLQSIEVSLHIFYILHYTNHYNPRFQTHGELLKFRPKELGSQFYKCLYNTVLILRSSKPNHR